MASTSATGGATIGLRFLSPAPRRTRLALSPPFLKLYGPPQFPSTRYTCSRKVLSPVMAAQSTFFKVVQTAWRVCKDAIEAGTNLVPKSVPRPVARISVAVAAVTFSIFLLKSFLSTAFFVLAMMGLIYFVFVAFNSAEGSGGKGGSTTTMPNGEDPLEEARRIMEKYK